MKEITDGSITPDKIIMPGESYAAKDAAAAYDLYAHTTTNAHIQEASTMTYDDLIGIVELLKKGF